MGSSRPLLIVLAAGAALALTLPKFGLSPLAWCAPAVLLYYARRAKSVRMAALLGGLFGFAYCFITLFWVYWTCRFAGVPIPISILAVTSLSAVLAINWAVFGAAVGHTAGRFPSVFLPWIWAILWTAIESASSHWIPRFAVDQLAYTQFRYLELIQIGALLGPHGLALALMLLNGALAEVAVRPRTRGQRRNFAAAVGLMGVFLLYGFVVLSGRSAKADGPRVEILQPNIDQYKKWDTNYVAGIRGAFDGLLARKRTAPPDLILWPESAVPGWIGEEENSRWVGGHARALKTPMIVGAVSRGLSERYNSGILFDAAGRPSRYYHKRQLVPFGEFVPMRAWFESWIGILAEMGDFDSGRRVQSLMEAGGMRIAINICYEAVFPHLLQIDSQRGARVFANLTNDGWYKDTAAPYQHFTVNVFRAIENRVTVLRAANTGISGVIDPYGVIIARTRLGEKVRLDVRLAAVDPFPDGSFFSRHGDILGFLSMAATLILLLGFRKRAGKP